MDATLHEPWTASSMTGDERRDLQRSTVDVTISRAAMKDVRDTLREQLIRQYHHLLISARTHRKVGLTTAARQMEREAQQTVLMIWCLDNPMDPPAEEAEPDDPFDDPFDTP